MNRRGVESLEIVLYIVRLIFLTVVLLSVTFLVRKFTVDNLDVRQVQADVYANRIYYSPTGILYVDPASKEIMSGVIDPSLITDQNLDRFIDYKSDSFIAGKVSLFDSDGTMLVTGINNAKSYNEWSPIARTGITGPGGITEVKKSSYVNYVINGTMRQGTMIVDILMPGN